MSENEESFKHLSINELQQMMAEKSPVIVDIRDLASFEESRISGAIHLSNESIADFMRTADLDAPVVVCCYHGHSSQQAAQFLVSQDFTVVYSLDGGFAQWQLQYPTEIAK
ncbi:MAG: thiosulfate sulfurtransferase GlpE [Colwellia sp.]|nr:thiosulfate sulfurtransferase GlpE [Colwellia sp.]